MDGALCSTFYSSSAFSLFSKPTTFPKDHRVGFHCRSRPCQFQRSRVYTRFFLEAGPGRSLEKYKRLLAAVPIQRSWTLRVSNARLSYYNEYARPREKERLSDQVLRQGLLPLFVLCSLSIEQSRPVLASLWLRFVNSESISLDLCLETQRIVSRSIFARSCPQALWHAGEMGSMRDNINDSLALIQLAKLDRTADVMATKDQETIDTFPMDARSWFQRLT